MTTSSEHGGSSEHTKGQMPGMSINKCAAMAAVVPAFQLIGKQCPSQARVASPMQAEDYRTLCACLVHPAWQVQAIK